MGVGVVGAGTGAAVEAGVGVIVAERGDFPSEAASVEPSPVTAPLESQSDAPAATTYASVYRARRGSVMEHHDEQRGTGEAQSEQDDDGGGGGEHVSVASGDDDDSSFEEAHTYVSDDDDDDDESGAGESKAGDYGSPVQSVAASASVATASVIAQDMPLALPPRKQADTRAGAGRARIKLDAGEDVDDVEADAEEVQAAMNEQFVEIAELLAAMARGGESGRACDKNYAALEKEETADSRRGIGSLGLDGVLDMLAYGSLTSLQYVHTVWRCLS